MEKRVMVFRKYILPYSETFISAQGSMLPSYHADYVGFLVDNTGKDMLPKKNCYVLSDYAVSYNMSKLFYRLGYVNQKFYHDISSLGSRVIHAHFLNDGIDALRLREKLSIPLVATLHGHDIAKLEKKKWLRKTRKEFFHEVDKVIVVSDYIYNCALENGCPEEKLIKHHIGIDLDKFKFKRAESENPEILFVGRLVEKKGVIYLLKAMKSLAKKYPVLKLNVIGDGPLLPELKAYADLNKLNVEFRGVGTPEQIRDALSKSWVFAAPSITASTGDAEGLAMVFLEAQALKVPVVSFASGGIPEGVEEGVAGFLLQEKDVNGLAEKISYFIDNPAERINFGNMGRQRVENHFDVRKQCRLLEEIYDSVR